MPVVTDGVLCPAMTFYGFQLEFQDPTPENKYQIQREPIKATQQLCEACPAHKIMKIKGLLREDGGTWSCQCNFHFLEMRLKLSVKAYEKYKPVFEALRDAAQTGERPLEAHEEFMKIVKEDLDGQEKNLDSRDRAKPQRPA